MTNAVFHFETEWVIGKGNWNTRSVQEAESLLDHLRIVCSQKFERPKAKDVQSGQTVEKEKLVEREVVVKVKCRYCGALNDQMARKCVSCGGPM
jgi:ribosomal protein L40E